MAEGCKMFSYIHARSVPFSWVASMIRMGRKYIIDTFFKYGMDRIDFEFPATLKEYRERPRHYTQIDAYDGLEFDVLNFLEEISLEHTHPAAYFRVACMSVDQIHKGTIRPNGTRAVLSLRNKEKVFVGRIKAMDGHMKAYSIWCQTGQVLSDHNRRTCGLQRAILHIFMQDFSEYAHLCDEWPSQISKDFNLCNSCTEFGKEMFDMLAPVLWEQLPFFFGLQMKEIA